jgi:ketosteroid isomerase-like protein
VWAVEGCGRVSRRLEPALAAGEGVVRGAPHEMGASRRGRQAHADADADGPNHAGHARDRPPEGYSSVMSRESLRLVEAAYEALADRGFEAFAGYWDDDIEWQAIGGRFRGGDAGRAYLQEWSSSFDALTTEALEFIDVGNDQVVVWVRISGRAKGSGGIEPPPAYFATVVELRNSKIARAVEYPTLAEAVEAASASR